MVLAEALLLTIAAIAVLPTIVFLVALWRIGTGVKDIAHALLNDANQNSLAESAAAMVQVAALRHDVEGSRRAG